MNTADAYNSIICSDCEREERRAGFLSALPEGWDWTIDCGGQMTVICPDCNEAIEQRKTAQINARIVDEGLSELRAQWRSTWAPDAKNLRLHVPKPRTFAVFLEKQEAGDYRIAMTPEAVLMRWHPLGFWLTPDEADALAIELKDFAKLARRPGTLPSGEGGAK